MYQLRDYQLEEYQQIVNSMRAGHRSIMVQSPPRTGKTVLMAEIARKTTLNGGRIMFIVHRKEIVDQVRATFVEQGVDMNLATIGMVQTLTRKVDRLQPPAVLFVDEAHHVLAKSYRRILDAFPEAIHLMFTATPIRLNGAGFTDVADDLIVGKPIQWLIDHGNLAPIEYYAPKQIDTTLLKTKRTGEFTEESIKQAAKPKIYGNAVKHYLKLAKGKQAIAYTYNVASAHQLADEFNKQGITAAAVDGSTPKKVRDQIIEDYRNGNIQVVANNELFTEGLDLPNVDCVIMLRPTQSLALYLQFGMRCMNPRAGKTAIIIDHVGNVEKFGLPTDDRKWSLQGSKANGETVTPVTVCEACFGTFYRSEAHKDDSGRLLCPYCGHPLPVAKKSESQAPDTDDSAELAEYTAEQELMQRVKNKKVDDLKTVQEIVAYRKIHNYKPGWVYFQLKKRGLVRK